MITGGSMTSRTPVEIDPDLRIREELIGLHAVFNPFINCCSSPRGLMMASHLSQIVTIEGGEPQIIQTGLESQLAEATFSKKLEFPVRVISILKRYNGISANSVTGTSSRLVIVQNLDNDELDVIDIPRYHKLHQSFGFKYVLNDEALDPSVVNTVLPKDTVLADSPTVTKSGEYAFGVPANIAYLHIPEVTGDGVVISEGLAAKFQFRTYENVTIECGEKSFLLNLYGDDDNYKPFPEIGEYINSDRVIAATRDYSTELAPALVSKTDVMDYSVYFDKPFYSKAAGGKVVDIKVYHNSKARISTYTKTTAQLDKYSEALKQYYRDIITVYESKCKSHYAQYKTDLPVSEKFHRLLLDAYTVTENNRNVRYTYKNDPVDLYRIEFTIEHKTTPNRDGYKTTTLHGQILLSI